MSILLAEGQTSDVAAIISAVFAGFAVLVSLFSLWRSEKANERAADADSRANSAAESSHLVQLAEVEYTMRASIDASRIRFEDVALQHATALSEKERDEAYEDIKGTTAEAYINAYEEACTKYTDGKVDKTRFKKTYQVELRRLADSFPDVFAGSNNRYAIKSVYDEWENTEA